MIKHITPSTMIKEVDGKTLTILVEALLPGFGSPDFVVFENSISSWDPPWNTEVFTPEDKAKVLSELKKELDERKITYAIE